MALAWCGRRDHVPLLIRTLEDEDWVVRQAAWVSLTNLTGMEWPFDAMGSSQQRGAHPCHSIRMAACEALANLRNKEYHRPGDTADRLNYEKMAQVVLGVQTVLRELPFEKKMGLGSRREQ